MPRDSGWLADLHFIWGSSLGDRSREANNLFNLCPALGPALSANPLFLSTYSDLMSTLDTVLYLPV